MKAHVLEAFNTPYVLKDIAKPASPEGKDILIRVEAASFCHTDAVFAAGEMWQDLPRVGSHEFAGTIVEMGPDVPSSLNLEVGTLVGSTGRAFHPCGSCYECTNNDGDPEGYGVWCTKAGNNGLTRDGGFQEFAIVDSRQIAPVPKGLDALNTAPLMCAGVTIWSSLQTAGVKMEKGAANGFKVAISGAGGGLGHLGVQFAVKLGCKVVAIDASDSALKLLGDVVKDLGDLGSKVSIVDARKQTAADAKVAIYGKPEPGLEGEKGADAVLILPEAQQALDYGMELLRNHGTCVCVSFPKDGLRIQPRDLVFRHIIMKGVLTGRNQQLRAMIEFAAKEGVKAKIKVYPMAKLNELVEDYHKGTSGKLVIDITK